MFLKTLTLSFVVLHVLSARMDLGFNNIQPDFKARMSNVITNIKYLQTPEGIRLTAELSNHLFALHNILQQQHQRAKLPTSSNSQSSKKIIQLYVTRLFKTISTTQKYLQKQHLKRTIATGNNNIVIGDNNLVDGKVNKIKGSNNMIIGDQNLLSGDSNMLRGNSNSVVGSDTFVMGNRNMAKGSKSVVFGFDNKLDKDNSLVVGDYHLDLKQYRK